MHNFKCPDFVPKTALCEKKKKPDKNATKLSQMMMRFKSENMVLKISTHESLFKKQFRKKKIMLTFLTNISTTKFT